MRKKIIPYALMMSMAMTSFATTAYAETTVSSTVSEVSDTEVSENSPDSTSGSTGSTEKIEGSTTADAGTENGTEETKKIGKISVSMDRIWCEDAIPTAESVNISEDSHAVVDTGKKFEWYTSDMELASGTLGDTDYCLIFSLKPAEGYVFDQNAELSMSIGGDAIPGITEDSGTYEEFSMNIGSETECDVTVWIHVDHNGELLSGGKIKCLGCGKILNSGSSNNSSGSNSNKQSASERGTSNGGYSGNAGDFYAYSSPGGSATGSIPHKDGTSSTSSSGNSSRQNTPGPQNAEGWSQIGNDWFYTQNGNLLRNCWAMLGYGNTTHWYYFGENGTMQSGWLDNNGSRYYLNPVSDGTKGRMLVGWQKIGDKEYYFETVAGQNQGHMYRNETTPDGTRVDADGARIKQ